MSPSNIMKASRRYPSSGYSRWNSTHALSFEGIACFSSSSSHSSRGIQALCSLTWPYRPCQSWYLLEEIPIHATMRLPAISVRSDHCRTKSTIVSRVS